MNKYRNRKAEVEGFRFDSQKEAARYLQLKAMQAAGEISDLELQKRFKICSAIPGIKGSRSRFYVADFVYKTGDGQLVIEDVKSPVTRKNAVYSLKKQFVMALYPQYRFVET